MKKRIGKTNRRPLFMILTLTLWLAAIFSFSSETYQQQTIIPILKKLFSEAQIAAHAPDWRITYKSYHYSIQRDPYHFIEFVFRKGAHLFMYGILGAILFLQLRRRIYSLYVRTLLTLMGGALVAFVDEWNQKRSAGRFSTIDDVLIDVTGAAAGILIMLAVNSTKENKNQNGGYKM
ncbi:VanZ family protein [Cohnella sp. 56]|uniref:VanZ family protein n=1 Tax=Cohnella sp. 56 TaxID=3113722 RepID=UPI0030E8A5F4